MGILKSQKRQIEDNNSLDKSKEKSTVGLVFSQEKSTIIRGVKNLNEKIITIEKIKKILPEEEIIAEPISELISEKIIEKSIEIQPVETSAQHTEVRQAEPKKPVIPPIDYVALEKQKQVLQQQVELEIQQFRKKLFADIENEKKYTLDKAYTEGFEKGRKSAEEQVASQSAEILKSINDIVVEKNKVLKRSRGEVLRLALKVAEQILKSEISLNQAVCVNIVAEAISRITDKDRVIIRVNKADVDFVKMNKDRFSKHMGDIQNLIIQDDSRVDQGGCIIETDMGYIDATIATKLESITKALFKISDEEEALDLAEPIEEKMNQENEV